MTTEMIRFILTLALTKLIELPPATLKSYEPWLMRKHIRWCLEHVMELTKSEDEVCELRRIREMLGLLEEAKEKKAIEAKETGITLAQAVERGDTPIILGPHGVLDPSQG